MIRAVCFDFDGLIVDTETPAYQAWSQILSRYDVELPMTTWLKAVGTFMGFDPAALVRESKGIEVDGHALFAEKELIKAAICNSQPLMPGVAALLDSLQKNKIPRTVVSTSDRAWVSEHLARCQISQYFDEIITRESVSKVKPNPEPYLKASSLLGHNSSEVIVFEDSLNGVKAAKAAGCYCVAVPNSITQHSNFDLADQLRPSLEGLSWEEIRNWGSGA